MGGDTRQSSVGHFPRFHVPLLAILTITTMTGYLYSEHVDDPPFSYDAQADRAFGDDDSVRRIPTPAPDVVLALRLAAQPRMFAGIQNDHSSSLKLHPPVQSGLKMEESYFERSVHSITVPISVDTTVSVEYAIPRAALSPHILPTAPQTNLQNPLSSPHPISNHTIKKANSTLSSSMQSEKLFYTSTGDMSLDVNLQSFSTITPALVTSSYESAIEQNSQHKLALNGKTNHSDLQPSMLPMDVFSGSSANTQSALTKRGLESEESSLMSKEISPNTSPILENPVMNTKSVDAHGRSDSGVLMPTLSANKSNLGPLSLENATLHTFLASRDWDHPSRVETTKISPTSSSQWPYASSEYNSVMATDSNFSDEHHPRRSGPHELSSARTEENFGLTAKSTSNLSRIEVSATTTLSSDIAIDATAVILEPSMESHVRTEEQHLPAGTVAGIVIASIGFIAILAVVLGMLIFKKFRSLGSKAYENKLSSDTCSYLDNLQVSYINNHIDIPKESTEEMFSLDNDSFLNSLEAMTMENYWAEDNRCTKV